MHSAFDFSFRTPHTEQSSTSSGRDLLQETPASNQAPTRKRSVHTLHARSESTQLRLNGTSAALAEISRREARGELSSPTKLRSDLVDGMDWLEEDGERASKRRRMPTVSDATDLAGKVLSTALGAAVMATALGFVAFRAWRDGGADDEDPPPAYVETPQPQPRRQVQHIHVQRRPRPRPTYAPVTPKPREPFNEPIETYPIEEECVDAISDSRISPELEAFAARIQQLVLSGKEALSSPPPEVTTFRRQSSSPTHRRR